MGDRTKIEWSDATWTPIRARNLATGKIGWHCEHATTGCEFCYAEGMNKRLGTGLPFKPGHRKDIKIFLDETMLTQPLRWKKPRMIFVCSMTDLFASFVTDEMIDRIFAVMALCPQHTFQVLTKRPERMREYLTRAGTVDRSDVRNHLAWNITLEVMTAWFPNWKSEGVDGIHRSKAIQACTIWPLPNVWLGTSCETQATADERIPDLLDTPAAMRWVSAEPLLTPIDFTEWLHDSDCHIRTDDIGLCTCSDPREVSIDWIVSGSESGPHARPIDNDAHRSIRDQCKAAGVAFFAKQLTVKGRLSKEIAEFPDDLQIQQLPELRP